MNKLAYSHQKAVERKKWGILSNLFQPANGEEEESETEQHNVGQHSINAGNTNKKGGLMSALGKLTRR
ncbi:hypothetical protein WR25_19138 [Diploscapter pachys]|uniref:Uncharacterized protein n=1 Tax=Diploscapter pachys TaxID=2018661 RepID=A0A2A2KPT0_9BILA|nr:hypothetical protein WR25_19138 [Diploscapter pachys]